MLKIAAWTAAALLSAAVPNDRAVTAFERGEKALAANQLEDAAAAYREALKATPGYAAALNGLGSVFFKQGKKDEAIAQFRAAVEADPSFKLGWFNLGYSARKSGDFSTAAEAYEQYTKLDPSDADGYYGLGESYRQKGDGSRAIAAYETYLQKEQRPTEQKWIDKAKGYVAELRAHAAAPSASGTATGTTSRGANNPALAASKIAEGDRAMASRQYRDAAAAYQQATEVDSSNIEALFKLGNANAVLGNYAQAIDRWTRVSDLTTDPAVRKSAQDNITKARAKMGSTAATSSNAAATTTVSSAPVTSENASPRERARQSYEQGVKAINGNDFSTAVQALTQTIQLEPTLPLAYVARGSAYIGLRRFAEAAADYQYALRLDARLTSPLYGLGEAYRAMGRTTDARQYYEKYASSSGPDARPELQAQARQKADRLR